MRKKQNKFFNNKNLFSNIKKQFINFTIFSGLLTTNSITNFSKIGFTLFAKYYLDAGSLIFY